MISFLLSRVAVTSAVASKSPSSIPWLFSPTVDLLTFLGSAVIAFGLLAVGAPLGLLEQDTPEWTWVVAILLVDVAHVYATGFRVYFDRQELSRRPWLYGLTPILSFLVGAAIYSESHDWFWRLLAYLAVFHFIRQQYGWVALYRSRGHEEGKLGRWIDSAAIYLATIYPLVYWHAHLPRNFWWFLQGDFAQLPEEAATLLAPIYWLSLIAYFVRAGYRGFALGKWNPGKDLVVATTAVCWHVGIITFNSDYAFTVTNVIIHGIPYMVLVYWYRCVCTGERVRHWPKIAGFLGTVWMLAYAEELLWDVGLWHERGWLFGMAWDLAALHWILVPLLAVPQITHYVLDGFIWKRRATRRLF
jgi:hypothetical protein